MWTYYGFKIAGCTLAHLPSKIGYFIATLIADIAYILSPKLRAAVKDNMRHVLGTQTHDVVLNQAARGVVRNAAMNYFDLISLPHTTAEAIERRLNVSGWEHLECALNKGKGVVLVTAHLGSFDLAVQLLAARSVKTTVLVESLQPPVLLEHVTALRSSNGVSFVAGYSGVIKDITATLRRGEVVLFACDRDVGNNGTATTFFGTEAILPTTAIRIAMRTGASVIPVFNLRRENRRYDVFFEPAIDIIRFGNGAVIRNTEQVARILEKYIQQYPSQWVVLSPFWVNGHQFP